MARSVAKLAPDTISGYIHTASSPYWAQYSRKPSFVVEKDTPKTIIFAASLGGPSAPGRAELGMSGIVAMLGRVANTAPRSGASAATGPSPAFLPQACPRWCELVVLIEDLLVRGRSRSRQNHAGDAFRHRAPCWAYGETHAARSCPQRRPRPVCLCRRLRGLPPPPRKEFARRTRPLPHPRGRLMVRRSAEGGGCPAPPPVAHRRCCCRRRAVMQPQYSNKREAC
jgi:hypothetical protein